MPKDYHEQWLLEHSRQFVVVLVSSANVPGERERYYGHSHNLDSACQEAVAKWNLAHDRFASNEAIHVPGYKELLDLTAENEYWELTVFTPALAL